MSNREPISPLSHLCMAITGIIDAALAQGLITLEDHTKIHSATWNARINSKERELHEKDEAA